MTLHRKAVALAVAVLAGGLGWAVAFYRTTPATPQLAVTRPGESIRRRAIDDGPRFLMEVRSMPPEALPVADSQPTARPLDKIAGLPLFEATADELPWISPEYPPADAPATAGQSPSQAVRHRIIDGDTLPALAQRYLGDASRGTEIYEKNRDVLASPELLPIGAWLRIPPK